MKIQITTDYAIRIIIYLAQNDNQVLTANEMAKQLGITYTYFLKVVARIKQAGYIESIQGPVGGYRLKMLAEDITLYDIIQTMEGDIHINRCLEEDGFCSRHASQFCPLHKIFESVQNELIDNLRSRRISEILKTGERIVLPCKE